MSEEDAAIIDLLWANAKRMTVIEGMLEGLCMGAYSALDIEEKPQKSKAEKTLDERRHEFATMVGMATDSYGKDNKLVVRIDADDGTYMEATSTFKEPPLSDEIVDEYIIVRQGEMSDEAWERLKEQCDRLTTTAAIEITEE